MNGQPNKVSPSACKDHLTGIPVFLLLSFHRASTRGTLEHPWQPTKAHECSHIVLPTMKGTAPTTAPPLTNKTFLILSTIYQIAEVTLTFSNSTAAFAHVTRAQGNNECSHSDQIVAEQWGDALHVCSLLCCPLLELLDHVTDEIFRWHQVQLKICLSPTTSNKRGVMNCAH